VQLKDIVDMVGHHGADRFMRKRAGVVLPLAIGAMLPGIGEKAVHRASGTEKALNQAAGAKVAAWSPPPSFGGNMKMPSSLGISLPAAAMGGQAAHGIADSFKGLAGSPLQGVASGISGGIGESIKRMLLGREFGERKDPMHMGGSAAISSFGKEMGTTGANLLRDIANKAMESVSHAGDESARHAILGDLKQNDPVLSAADDKTLMEAYHTMTRFAPTLSTDKNAVRSFLRQAVMSGSGPDYMSIKLIADSERSVTGGGKDK